MSKRPFRKLAIIGHTYAIAHNREKAAALSRHYDVSCIVPVGKNVVLMGQDLSSFDASEEPEGEHVVHELRASGSIDDATRQYYYGLGELLDEIRPDIILCEAEPWAVVRWQAAMWARKSRSPRTLFCEFTWENVRRPGLKGGILDLAYAAAARTGHLVVCGNDAAVDLFVRAGKPREHCLKAPQLGVPDEGYTIATEAQKRRWRKESGLPADALVVGFCGRFTESKGVSNLIAAVRSIRETSDREVVLAFLGAGEMKDAISSEIDGFGAILPPVPHREVPHIMSHWDILVLPSNPVTTGDACWEEQYGRVLIEAMAAGVPALGSSSGAIPEVVRFPEAVFRHGDASHLTEVLGSYVSDPVGLKDLWERQYAYVMDECTDSRLAARYAEFFDAHV